MGIETDVIVFRTARPREGTILRPSVLRVHVGKKTGSASVVRDGRPWTHRERDTLPQFRPARIHTLCTRAHRFSGFPILGHRIRRHELLHRRSKNAELGAPAAGLVYCPADNPFPRDWMT